jgi:muramidase (phage lysozyme)
MTDTQNSSIITPSQDVLCANQTLTQNQRAFLYMLSKSEGTFGHGENGYNMIVNPGGLFTSYADHPRKLVQVNDNLCSTAAGRYQILARTFDAYKKLLNLPDFSPDSQDAIAIQIIKERHALDSLLRSDITAAIIQCSNIWASLPGNSYGQHQNSMNSLVQNYQAAGGTIIG